MLGFTNTRESGLESLIVKYLVEQNGYEERNNADYNKEYTITTMRSTKALRINTALIKLLLLYRTTILSGETDQNKLYDLVATMEGYQVYSDEDVERLVNLYLDGADRDKLDPTLDACTAIYKQLETNDQIKFKSAAKAFVRTYGFLSAIQVGGFRFRGRTSSRCCRKPQFLLCAQRRTTKKRAAKFVARFFQIKTRLSAPYASAFFSPILADV